RVRLPLRAAATKPSRACSGARAAPGARLELISRLPLKYVAFYPDSIHLDSTPINATGVEDEHLDRTSGPERIRRQPGVCARTGPARGHRTRASAAWGRPTAIIERSPQSRRSGPRPR